jgi:hypothetical protein
VTAQKCSIGELLAWIYALVRIIVRRLAKTKYLIFQASSKIMTLIRLIQRASILAGMTFAILPVHGNPAQADTPQFCVVASNGKTACGTLKAVERACVTTDAGGVVCGKFKSAREEQAQGQESRQPVQGTIARKEVDNFVYILESCQRVDTNVRCQIKMVNKGKERNVYSLASESSLVDSTGKSHPGFKVDLGGSPNSNARSIIAPGTEVYFGIAFDTVPVSIVKAQLLNLRVGDKPVQFRNIPISN